MITHIKDSESDKVLVFIHGLGGSKYTWSRFSEYLNNNWQSELALLIRYFTYYRVFVDKEAVRYRSNKILCPIIDLTFSVCGILYFPFKAFWSKRNLHNVKLLEKYIEENCEGSRNIILIAHSMGGLIARQFLIDQTKQQNDISKYRLLVTYATPHQGSHWASRFSLLSRLILVRHIYDWISTFFNYRISPQIGDLAKLNRFISELEDEWSIYNISKNVALVRMVATKDFLVREQSAMLNHQDIQNVHYFEYGHSGIINPRMKKGFRPIDLLIKELGKIKFEEEFFEELEEEIDYDFEDSMDTDSY